jgi:hypothetical protein
MEVILFSAIGTMVLLVLELACYPGMSSDDWLRDDEPPTGHRASPHRAACPRRWSAVAVR